MAQITARITFDPTKDSATVALELAGHSEMEHELLAQFFQSQSVTLVPFHSGDALESRFVIVQPGAYKKAQRAVENRIRARDNRPSVEQEEEAKAAKVKAQQERETADAEAKKLGYANADERTQHEHQNKARKELAKAIADEIQERAAKPSDVPDAT